MLAMIWLLAPLVLVAGFFCVATLLGLAIVIVCYVQHKRAGNRDGTE
jgi:hypothetical protein